MDTLKVDTLKEDTLKMKMDTLKIKADTLKKITIALAKRQLYSVQEQRQCSVDVRAAGQDSVPAGSSLPDNVSLALLHQLCQQAGSLARTQYIIFGQCPLRNRLEGTRKGTERQFTKTQLALKFEKFNLTQKRNAEQTYSIILLYQTGKDLKGWPTH